MSKIEEKIEAAWQRSRGEKEYDPGYPVKASSNFVDGYKAGAADALSHQWVSVDEELPKAKDYESFLMPSMADDRPRIFVVTPFLLNVVYNDGSGHDYCEANFEILPDGEFRWSYNDEYIEARIGTFKVTHWLPIPPLPEARKENEV